MAYTSNRAALDRRLKAAIEGGINETTGKGVRAAQPITPVDTGRAKGSLRNLPAKWESPWRCVGVFGSFEVPYWIYIEKGTRYMHAHHVLERARAQVVPGLSGAIKRRL